MKLKYIVFYFIAGWLMVLLASTVIENYCIGLAAKSVNAVKITYDTPVLNESPINVIGSIELYEENIESAKLTIGAITNEPSIASLNVGDVLITGIQNKAIAEITTPETITTINAGSVGTVKITYDAPQTVEDITNVVG